MNIYTELESSLVFSSNVTLFLCRHTYIHEGHAHCSHVWLIFLIHCANCFIHYLKIIFCCYMPYELKFKHIIHV